MSSVVRLGEQEGGILLIASDGEPLFVTAFRRSTGCSAPPLFLACSPRPPACLVWRRAVGRRRSGGGHSGHLPGRQVRPLLGSALAGRAPC